MEFKASKMKCGADMPVMILNGQGKVPYYTNPCDSTKLHPMGGQFSVDSDKPKVIKVLNELYADKTRSYLELYGDLDACALPL